LFSFFDKSSSSWLAKPANQWPYGGYSIMDHVVRTLNVENNVAERSIKLLHNFSGKITTDDVTQIAKTYCKA